MKPVVPVLLGSLVALAVAVVAVRTVAACGPECALSQEDLRLLKSPGSFRVDVDAAPRPGDSPPAPVPFAAAELEKELVEVLEGEGVPVHGAASNGGEPRLLVLKARAWRDGDGWSYSLDLSPEAPPSHPKDAAAEKAWPHRSYGPVAAEVLQRAVLRHVRAMGRQLGRLYREARNSQ